MSVARGRPIALLLAVLRLALACLLLGLPAHAAELAPTERDAIVSRAWLHDPDGTLTQQQAFEQAWTPFEGVLGRGFVAGSTWLRLKIDPAAAGPALLPGDHRLVLLIRPGHLDEVTAFRVDSLSTPIGTVGDTTQARIGGSRGLAHRIVIAEAVEPFELLLRIRSVGNHSVGVKALRWDDARNVDHRQALTVTAFLVFTALTTVLAALLWRYRRDPLLGLFVLVQCATLVYSVAVLGVLRQYGSDLIPSDVVDKLTSVTLPIYLGLMIKFHLEFLRYCGARSPEFRLLQASLLLPVLGLLLIAVGYARTGLFISHLTISGAVLLILVTAWRADLNVIRDRFTNHRQQRAYIVGVYAIMAAFALPQLMRVLGLRSAGSWSFSGFMLYSILSTLLIGSLLLYRSREIIRRQRAAEFALIDMQRSVDEQKAREEREYTESLERLVAQRTRELEELATTDELTRLANRRLFRRRLREEFSRAQRHGASLALVSIDLDHFKPINDRHGHDAGDRVLAAVAGILASMTRASDVVARYGGEEFALLLVETDVRGARDKAEQIRQAIEASEIDIGGGQLLRVTASLGVAVHQGGAQQSPESLLKAADAALYRAKHGGRNQVCAAD